MLDDLKDKIYATLFYILLGAVTVLTVRYTLQQLREPTITGAVPIDEGPDQETAH